MKKEEHLTTVTVKAGTCAYINGLPVIVPHDVELLTASTWAKKLIAAGVAENDAI